MASKFLVTVTTPEDMDMGVSGDDTQTCKNLAGFFDKVASGNTGAATIRVLNDAVVASGTVAIAGGALSANDTVIVGTVTFTCVAASPTEIQFIPGANAAASATNLAAAINAHSALQYVVSASVNSGTVTVTSLLPGLVGNQIRLAEGTDANSRMTVTAMANGAETTITFST